jgi:hypothetical protein
LGELERQDMPVARERMKGPTVMRAICLTVLCLVAASLWVAPLQASDFGLAGNALEEFKAIRYENVYTKVPTTGKLVSVKIADSGRVYYICKEKASFVIYHLEIRPMEGFKEKIEHDLKDKSKKWEKVHPDELLFTRERFEHELKKRFNKYSEAVWVRNEIVINEPAQRPDRAEK